MTTGDIRNIEAEAGVIASALMNPELIFYSEQLKPNHFTNPQNAYIYYAVCELAKQGVDKIDAYNVINLLNLRKGTSHVGDNVNTLITIQSLQELIENAKLIARSSLEDYMVIVSGVLDAAFRRSTYQKLSECQRICLSGDETDIEKRIYSTLDDVMMEFSTNNEIPQFKDVVQQYWEEIEERQAPGGAGVIPFKFKTLNAYVVIERGELVIFGAEQKQGKSMLLLNCAADLLRNGYKVLYLDSELNSRLFTCRMLSHLTGIEFRRVRSGRYTPEERERIVDAVGWLQTREFTHLYMPLFDEQSIYTAIKKVYHTQGIDVLIIDYFKGGDDKDAFASYQSLGGLVDLIKNKVCGDMNIAGIGAAQATSTGRLADSAKIARNASTIVMLQDKSPEEIQADGQQCGNKKLVVRFNRNGPQMSGNEYIDMNFVGDIVSYEEARAVLIFCLLGGGTHGSV